MPRRLPERARHMERKPRRFKRFGGSRFQTLPFQQAPVKEGEEIDVVIDDIGSRGDGITRVKSFLIFVPQTKIGERLRVRIAKIKGRFAIAKKIR